MEAPARVEATPEKRRRRGRRRPLLLAIVHGASRRVRRALVALACMVLPRVYTAYMRFVWWTSRVENEGFVASVRETARAHGGVVGVLWHEEVFSVAWAYREARPHTLASLGDAGEAITRLLERCGYVVFRGGSSHKRSRRRGAEVLASMIAHMRVTPGVIYGITVDGSSGPLYHVKHGALVIARECNVPVLLVRTWARWNIHVPTWDRMAVPLPFNHIRQYSRGPYFMPEDAGDPAVFEAFRGRIEADLVALAAESKRF